MLSTIERKTTLRCSLCSRHGLERRHPIDEFDFDRSRSRGYQSSCKFSRSMAKRSEWKRPTKSKWRGESKQYDTPTKAVYRAVIYNQLLVRDDFYGVGDTVLAVCDSEGLDVLEMRNRAVPDHRMILVNKDAGKIASAKRVTMADQAVPCGTMLSRAHANLREKGKKDHVRAANLDLMCTVGPELLSEVGGFFVSGILEIESRVAITFTNGRDPLTKALMDDTGMTRSQILRRLATSCGYQVTRMKEGTYKNTTKDGKPGANMAWVVMDLHDVAAPLREAGWDYRSLQVLRMIGGLDYRGIEAIRASRQ